MTHSLQRGARMAILSLPLLVAAGCNPSSGGATHPRDGTEVVPAASKTVCADGTPPPCQP